MDYAAFLKSADAGQLGPATLLHGPEPFLLEDAAARVTAALFPVSAPAGGEPGASVSPVDLALVREVFDARDGDVEAVVGSALMLPWLSSRRLVVVKGAEGLTAKRADPLIAYLKAPNPSTALLILSLQPLPASHWLIGAVPASAVVPVLAPAGRQLVSWLGARARADGFELSESAASLMAELSGGDLTQLRGDIAKAALAGGPDNRRVGVEEVRAVVGEHRLRHVFELTRALIAGDAGAALSVLEALLNSGEEPLAILGMLGREVRALALAADGLGAGRREDDIARELRRPPAAANAVIARARGLGPGRAARLLERCWDAERRIKLSGPTRPEMSLLVAQLCSG